MFVFDGYFGKFFKRRKSKNKKILKKFQNNYDIYLAALQKGVWLPFLPINSTKYVIKLQNTDSPFSDEWEQKISYDGFNIEIRDVLWIAAIGHFYTFDKEKFVGKEISYQTLDEKTIYSGFRYDVDSGKYLLSIKGFKRKKLIEYPGVNYGYLFSLNKVDTFDRVNDPRDDEIYSFIVK